MCPETLAVCTPQQFLCPPAPEGPARQLPQNDRQRIIQPDDCLCLGPDQVAYNAIVPCHNPSLGLCCFSDPGTEDVQRGALPVWLPVQGIQFDVIQVKSAGELFCKRGLARTRHTDDN